MKIKKFNDVKLYQRLIEFTAILNRGVQMAIAENDRKGIASVFANQNKIFYKMPDGTITTKSPFKKTKK